MNSVVSEHQAVLCIKYIDRLFDAVCVHRDYGNSNRCPLGLLVFSGGRGSCDFQKCGFSPFSDTVHSKLLIFFHRDDQP